MQQAVRQWPAPLVTDALWADPAVAERAEADVVDAAQHVTHVQEPGALLAWQVDLRHVAGDDHLRPEAEARQEHLHLLGRGVLRLVEDDETVVKASTPHESQRGNFD